MFIKKQVLVILLSSAISSSLASQWNDPAQAAYRSYGVSTIQQQQRQSQSPYATEPPLTERKNDSLPPGWSEHFDPNSGQPYYYNTNDGTTTWDRPSSLLETTGETAPQQQDVELKTSESAGPADQDAHANYQDTAMNRRNESVSYGDGLQGDHNPKKVVEDQSNPYDGRDSRAYANAQSDEQREIQNLIERETHAPNSYQQQDDSVWRERANEQQATTVNEPRYQDWSKQDDERTLAGSDESGKEESRSTMIGASVIDEPNVDADRSSYADAEALAREGYAPNQYSGYAAPTDYRHAQQQQQQQQAQGSVQPPQGQVVGADRSPAWGMPGIAQRKDITETKLPPSTQDGRMPPQQPPSTGQQQGVYQNPWGMQNDDRQKALVPPSNQYGGILPEQRPPTNQRIPERLMEQKAPEPSVQASRVDNLQHAPPLQQRQPLAQAQAQQPPLQPPLQQQQQQQQPQQRTFSQQQQQQRPIQQSPPYGQGPPRPYPGQQGPPQQYGGAYRQGYPGQQSPYTRQYGQTSAYGQYGQPGQPQQGQLVEAGPTMAVKEALGKTWQGLLGFGNRTKEAVGTVSDTVVRGAQEAGQTFGSTSSSWLERARNTFGSMFETVPEDQQYSLSGTYGTPSKQTQEAYPQRPGPYEQTGYSPTGRQGYPPQQQQYQQGPPRQQQYQQGYPVQKLQGSLGQQQQGQNQQPMGQYPPGYTLPQARVDPSYPHQSQGGPQGQGQPPMQSHYGQGVPPPDYDSRRYGQQGQQQQLPQGQQNPPGVQGSKDEPWQHPALGFDGY